VADKKVKELEGHLMLYPIEVDSATGAVASAIPTFPDTAASVLGSDGFAIPNKLTM
jgi:hypothetical protein